MFVIGDFEYDIDESRFCRIPVCPTFIGRIIMSSGQFLGNLEHYLVERSLSHASARVLC
uniref:Phosphatase n=1 Tax=Heterorhabditis bacteriophora TaxID=37862 RepID=A0A1I7WSZ1_HETBA